MPEVLVGAVKSMLDYECLPYWAFAPPKQSDLVVQTKFKDGDNSHHSKRDPITTNILTSIPGNWGSFDKYK